MKYFDRLSRYFDGIVEASTEGRLSVSDPAVKLFSISFQG